jgi:tetratricopeptide (TPR) repeat protein
MRLWKAFGKPCYFLWAVASMYMQALDPNNTNPVVLNLCGSFIAKAHEQKQITTLERMSYHIISYHVVSRHVAACNTVLWHSLTNQWCRVDLRFYMEVLQKQGKSAEALALLELPEFVALFKLPYELHQAKIPLLLALNQQHQAIELLIELLDLIPDEWSVYAQLIDLAKCDNTSSELRQRIVQAIHDNRSKRDATGRTYRSAQLSALLEHEQLDADTDPTTFANTIVQYFELFGDKLV